MKKKYYFQSAVFAIILASFFAAAMFNGCTDVNTEPNVNDTVPNDTLPNDTIIVHLAGTKWKLAGIVDVETGVLTELEPTDCEECYTLAFNTDSTFLTFSSSNELGGGYIADYETYSFQILDFGGTKVGEIGDAELYTDLFWNKFIQFFYIKNNELRLYYNDKKKNYLLFKSQQP